MASWIGIKLSKPRATGEYHVTRACTAAIDLVYILRPILYKKESIETADRIIEMFKERATIPCDESQNILSYSEPKYVTAYKLHQEGMSLEDVAKRIGCRLKETYSLIDYAKNKELYLKRKREYYRRRRMDKRP